MHPTLFTIGPITVYSYGLMIAIGFFAALFLATKRAKKLGLNDDHVWNIWIVCIVGGLVGAKLLYFLVEIKSIVERSLTFSDIMNGFVVYGGILGGLIGIILYCRIKKISVLKYLDLVAPSVAVGQGFGRIGCLLAGCCYGRETSSMFSITFHNTTFAPTGVPLIPTQIISSAGDFLIMGILLYLAKKRFKDGLLICFYLILYGVGRFAVEFLRNDYRGSVAGLSTSQFISIFMVLGGILAIIYLGKRPESKEKEAAK